MRIILEVKDKILGNAVGILCLGSLSGFSLWWTLKRDSVAFVIASLFSLAWLGGICVLARNLRRHRSSVLGVEDGCLLWQVRDKERPTDIGPTIPLRTIRFIEVVFPKVRWEANERDPNLAEVFLVDIHGNRFRVP